MSLEVNDWSFTEYFNIKNKKKNLKRFFKSHLELVNVIKNRSSF